MYDRLYRHIKILCAASFIYVILCVTGIFKLLPYEVYLIASIVVLIICCLYFVLGITAKKHREDFEQSCPDSESCIQRGKISEIGADSHKGVKE